MDDSKQTFTYYESHYDESQRLKRHPLEEVRTREIIGRYLSPAAMEIADISGGAGAYAFWLAGLGHRVHFQDLSERHVRMAQERSEAEGLALASYTAGDARSLPYEDNQFDLVLMMGALYHLTRREGRLACIREARRVLKPGGSAIFAYVSLYTGIISSFKYDLLEGPVEEQILATAVDTGIHAHPERPQEHFSAFCHTPALIREELEAGGFPQSRLLAVEGWSNALFLERLWEDKRKRELLLHYLRITEDKPELLGCTSHLISVSRKE